MTIEKLPSGSYRITEMKNGQRIRITVKEKPTKSEAREMIASKAGGFNDKTLFKTAADRYIESKKNVLSPSTIRGYTVILRNLDEYFLNTPLYKINSPMLQAYINNISVKYKPKTIKNINGFIITVMKYYGSELKSPTLPKRIKEFNYIPTEEDIKRILGEVKGTKYEVPFVLASLGLRRSEICALTAADLNGNILTINKAIVEDEKGEWHIKTTKTKESTRTIVIPERIADLIRANGVYDSTPHSIYSALKRVQDKLEIPRFSLHKMRHFFASYMHNQGYSDKQIQEFGGWKTDEVMKTVYQHAMQMDEVKQNMAANIGSLLE